MKKTILKISIVSGLFCIMNANVFAANMYIEAPKTASANREAFPVTIFLDTGNTAVSGISGELTFPSDAFDVKSISAQNGVIPLWVVSPHITTETSFDQKTHIVFEGIVPGGFTGVHGSYDAALHPGIIFTLLLTPKNSGKANISLVSTEIHAYDGAGTLLASRGDTKEVLVPILSGVSARTSQDLRPVNSSDVTMSVETSDLVGNGLPYVFINDENPSHVIDHIEIAETDGYDPVNVSTYEWHTVHNPHVITYTSRNKYIHAKIVYADGTYTYKTVQPVENSELFSNLSRILIYIIIAIFLLYHYGKNFLYLLPKNTTKHA